jgi:uncharacterized protein YdhG (YjbR/CyaY superfamily)
MEKAKPKNIDEYIANFPPEVKKLLEEIRTIIKEIAPNATEVISYGMPAFKQNKVLVYFAGYKNHIGFYPTGSGIVAFKNELNDFKWSKGAVQFSVNKPLPINLIKKIVRFRLDTTQND